MKTHTEDGRPYGFDELFAEYWNLVDSGADNETLRRDWEVFERETRRALDVEDARNAEDHPDRPKDRLAVAAADALVVLSSLTMELHGPGANARPDLTPMSAEVAYAVHGLAKYVSERLAC